MPSLQDPSCRLELPGGDLRERAWTAVRDSLQEYEDLLHKQMTVFVPRTLDAALDPPACAPPNVFTDVPETSPFCRWIEELARRGVVTGCGGGTTARRRP